MIALLRWLFSRRRGKLPDGKVGDAPVAGLARAREPLDLAEAHRVLRSALWRLLAGAPVRDLDAARVELMAEFVRQSMPAPTRRELVIAYRLTLEYARLLVAGRAV